MKSSILYISILGLLRFALTMSKSQGGTPRASSGLQRVGSPPDDSKSCQNCRIESGKIRIGRSVTDVPDNAGSVTLDQLSKECNKTSEDRTFQVYDLEPFYWSNYLDEHYEQRYICSPGKYNNETCKKVIAETLENVSLVMNNVVQRDEDLASVRYDQDPKNPTKSFSLVLRYETHFNNTLSCVVNLTDGVRLVSKTEQMIVHERYEVSLIPAEMDVTEGSKYSLTCNISSARGLNKIVWYRKGSKQHNSNWATIHLKGGRRTKDLISYSTTTSPPHQVIVMGTEVKEGFKLEKYIYKCTTLNTKHSNQPEANAIVTILVRESISFSDS